MQETAATGATHSPKKRTETFRLTRGHIHKFLKELERTDHSKGTIDSYRRNLINFQAFLGVHQHVTSDSLTEQGYTVNSVNSRISAVNSL